MTSRPSHCRSASDRLPPPLVAVDVGNARVKFGQFGSNVGAGFPEPDQTLQLTGRQLELDSLARWLDQLAAPVLSWWIGSVNRPTATRLIGWLREQRPEDSVTLLAADDLPLEVAVERPDMVGVDRLLDAVAANGLRAPDRPAIVVDVGTAITVDLISADGVFLGGSILPGIAMSARAMHEFTDLLPLVEMAELAGPPPAVGASTIAAMKSGLFWGAIGAVRHLVERMSAEVNGEAEVFLTGGAGTNVARLLGQSTRHVPQLTLAGIALTAKALNG